MSTKPATPESQQCVPDRTCGFMKLWKQTFASGELSDVRFAVGHDFGNTESFPAHKLVLSLRSTVFRAMFYGRLPKKCRDAIIEIPDIHPDAFANMLRFIYTDAVDQLTTDNAFATMGCAIKYDLSQMAVICSTFITSHLNADNCVATLKQACGWHAASIVEQCMAIVDAKTTFILQSNEFPEISLDALTKILQRDTLSAEEHVIYLAVERWATAACIRNGLNDSGANRRQMLGAALFLVRFPLLTNTELAEGPSKSGLLTVPELLNLFVYHSAKVKPVLPFPAQRRKGQHGLRAGAQVFVLVPGSGFWKPARITKAHEQEAVFSWCKGGSEAVAPIDTVILAEHILQKDQLVLITSLGNFGYYDTALEGGLHRISLNGGRNVEFADLKLHDLHLEAWKTKHAKCKGLE